MRVATTGFSNAHAHSLDSFYTLDGHKSGLSATGLVRQPNLFFALEGSGRSAGKQPPKAAQTTCYRLKRNQRETLLKHGNKNAFLSPHLARRSVEWPSPWGFSLTQQSRSFYPYTLIQALDWLPGLIRTASLFSLSFTLAGVS